MRGCGTYYLHSRSGIFQVLHFPVLHFQSRIFWYCIFGLSNLTLLVPHFTVPHFQRTPSELSWITACAIMSACLNWRCHTTMVYTWLLCTCHKYEHTTDVVQRASRSLQSVATLLYRIIRLSMKKYLYVHIFSLLSCWFYAGRHTDKAQFVRRRFWE